MGCLYFSVAQGGIKPEKLILITLPKTFTVVELRIQSAPTLYFSSHTDNHSFSAAHD